MKLKNILFKKFFLSFVFLYSCKEIDPFRFSKGVDPTSYSIEQDSVRDKKSGKILSDSKSCMNCHKTIYDNWNNSRHRVAFTNELYQESHEREPMQWCVNCHAPLLKEEANPDLPNERLLSEEGISCIVCHVRNKKILTSKLPALSETEYAHDYEIAPSIGKSEFCANCHQFNFPTIKSTKSKDRFVYSHLPMQNTVKEFKESFFSHLGECQTCHLESKSANTHSFYGGHDKEKLASSIFLQIERITRYSISLKVITNGIAHSFPTGDLFRTLKIRIKDEKTKQILSEVWLKKTYVDAKKGIDKNEPSMSLVEDNVILPPLESHTSQKSFILLIPENIEDIEAELILDYLHGINRLLSNIPEKLTSLPIKKVCFKLKKIKESG